MSTASAVLRRIWTGEQSFKQNGTYVYCFGGIETLLGQCNRIE